MISPIFHNFWRNCRNRSVCWVPFLYLLHHLNLVILANTMISLIFCKFFEKLQKLQKWQFLPGTLLPPLTLVLILAKSVICPIFRNFWRNHRTCRNRSFCWAPLLPLLTLVLINFSKNCDFSNFSQVLLLRANLDISHCSAFFSHTCTCKPQEYSRT